MANQILIVVPTRNRPDNVRRFWKSYKKNTAGNSDVVLVTDTDDLNDYSYTGFIIEQNPRMSVIDKINTGIKNHLAGHSILGFLGDDSTVDTKDFDKKIFDKLSPHRLGILRPSNGFDTFDNIDHVFMTRGLYDFLGWFAYPEFEHTFVDIVWRDVAEIMDTTLGKYFHDTDIVCTHHHPFYFKNIPEDELYKTVYSPERNKKDRLVYEDWILDGKIRLKSRVKNLVSLVMITHNRLEYLKLSLRTLLNQSYKDFHLVIWDNNSEQDVLDYLDTITDSRVVVVKNKANDSLASVVGKVFSDFKTDLIGKVDPDILLPPNWLERCVLAHRKFPFGVIGGFHFRPEDLDGIKPNITTHEGVSIWEKTHIGGCSFILNRKDFKKYSGEGLFGFTEYQHTIHNQGKKNGYLWDPILYVEHMEDSRSAFCIKTKEYQDYKLATRGMTIEDYTAAMYINNNYLKINSE